MHPAVLLIIATACGRVGFDSSDAELYRTVRATTADSFGVPSPVSVLDSPQGDTSPSLN